MPTPDDDMLLRMDGWPGGVNNRIRETEQAAMREGERIPSSQFLRKALNVDLTAEGHPLRRKGYALHTAGYSHSAWGCEQLAIFCVVIEGMLYAGRSPDNLQVMAPVNRYNPVSYCFVNDTIYYSNGQQLGEITYALEHRDWSIPVAPAPTADVQVEKTPEGWEQFKQVSCTYVDQYGREGGASEPILVGGEDAFTLTVQMPLPPGISEMRVYVSQPMSEILYHTETLLTASTVTIYPSQLGKGKELDTLNMHPPKAGQLVAELAGRIYIARNDKVVFTEPLKYHLTRPSQGIFMFPDYITLLQASTDGIYVGTEQGVVFLNGTDPYDVRQVHVTPYAPVEQAVSRVPGEKFGVAVEEVPVWWGADGVMVVGLPGGQLRQLTRDRLAVQGFQAGAVSLREQEGMSHIVSNLRAGDGLNPMSATDTVVAEVRQHNIVLNS